MRLSKLDIPCYGKKSNKSMVHSNDAIYGKEVVCTYYTQHYQYTHM